MNLCIAVPIRRFLFAQFICFVCFFSFSALSLSLPLSVCVFDGAISILLCADHIIMYRLYAARVCVHRRIERPLAREVNLVKCTNNNTPEQNPI